MIKERVNINDVRQIGDDIYILIDFGVFTLMRNNESVAHMYVNTRPDTNQFIIRDIMEVKSDYDIVVIEEIRRNLNSEKGDGELLLKYVTEFIFKDDVVVVLKAVSYYTNFQMDMNTFIKYQNKLIKWYEKNGFISINNIIGCEGGEAMILLNTVGKVIFRGLNE